MDNSKLSPTRSTHDFAIRLRITHIYSHVVKLDFHAARGGVGNCESARLAGSTTASVSMCEYHLRFHTHFERQPPLNLEVRRVADSLLICPKFDRRYSTMQDPNPFRKLQQYPPQNESSSRAWFTILSIEGVRKANPNEG
jgi:hypothetical protein